MLKFVFVAKTVTGSLYTITIIGDNFDEEFKRAKEMADGMFVYPLTNEHGWEKV